MILWWNKRRQPILSGLAVLGLLLLQAQLLAPFGQQTQTQPPAQPAVAASYSHLPLAFEPNQGQAGDGVDFLVHHGQAVTAFSGTSSTTSVGGKQVTMALDGANKSSFAGQDELPSKTNYFVGNDQSQWHNDIPNFQKLLAKNVYPGIDLSYYGTNSQLEHDFIVNPGADYHQIAFRISGQDSLAQDHDGNLVLKAGDETLQLNTPTTYQLGDHDKHTIPSQFKLDGNTVTVAVTGEYDHTKPLVIDPTLVYSTYLGGSGFDSGQGIVIDANGDAYVVGAAGSTNFPTASAYQTTNAGGGNDAFVTKFDPSGSAVIYSTYLGGSGNDAANKVVLDLFGDAFVAGVTTSTDFPTWFGFQGTYGGGGEDVFVTKLDAGGSTLQYSTYLGGSATDGDGLSPDIAIDGFGNAYVAGSTHSADFPTASPYQASLSGLTDAFVAKVSADGTTLAYGTYLGGSGQEAGARIALDAYGSIYLAGNTASTDFPTASPYQAANAGGATDAFLAKLTATGSSLSYATYFGGSDYESIGGLALDSTGSAYLTGYTASTNLPTASAFQASFGGTGGAYGDAFVTKFNSSGSAISYSTYLGGSDDDAGLAIAVNAAGNAYVTGLTGSTNFPTSSPYQSAKAGGISDGFVTKLSTAGTTLSYSTYLGGSSQDQPMAIALSLSGEAFITGFTNSTNFPTLTPFQAANAGSTDAFVAELTDSTVNVSGQVQPILTFTLSTSTCDLGQFSPTQTKSCTHTMSAGSNAANGYTISYIPTTTLTNGSFTIDAMASQAASILGTEQFGLNLKANTAAGSNTASDFGADPSGGSGTAATGYNTANQFKFATGGATIAQTTGTSAVTTYTVSFIANMSSTTEPGTYATPITYDIVASY